MVEALTNVEEENNLPEIERVAKKNRFYLTAEAFVVAKKGAPKPHTAPILTPHLKISRL